MNKDLIRGTLKPLILSVLKEKKSLYGYEMAKLIGEITNDNIKLTDGSLYPMLHKLEKDYLVQSNEKSIGKRKRKYYQLTTKGIEESERTVEELLQFLKSIVLVLKPHN